MLLHLSGILFLLSKLLIASSTENEEVLNVATPSVIKANFIDSIQSGDLEAAKLIANDNGFITSQFNADIFAEVLKCYKQYAGSSECNAFYDLVEPSFAVLSKSETTPLIMVIFDGNSEVFNKLVEIPSLLSAVDAHKRSPLMYAARLDREYMMARMVMYGLDKVENREELLNLRDKDGKTVLHFVCESNQSSEDKVRWVKVLKANGAQVVQDVPYQASIWEMSLRDEFVPLQAEVYHKNWEKSVAIAHRINRNFLILLAFLNRVAILDIIIPRLFMVWNSLPVQACQALFYYAEQLALEGFDSNIVISFDLPSGIYDFSFNLLMLLFIALMIKVSDKPPAQFRY